MRMMQNFGVPVPRGQWPTVKAYLVKNFPEKPRPAADILAGSVKAAMKNGR